MQTLDDKISFHEIICSKSIKWMIANIVIIILSLIWVQEALLLFGSVLVILSLVWVLSYQRIHQLKQIRGN